MEQLEVIDLIKNRYLSNHKENTLRHVEEVADTAVWLAREYFDINDQDILDAIECHTTLKKNAGMYDKVIFIADKISWDQKDVPPYYDLLKSKAMVSLDEACYFYIKYQFENSLLLMPHQWIKEAYEDLKMVEVDN